MRLIILLAMFLAAGLSGCIDDSDPVTPATADDAGPADTDGATNRTADTNTTGTIRVVALTPDLDRVADAAVQIDGRNTTTGTDGVATVSDLVAGFYTVVVTKDGWRAAKTGVEVQAGKTVDVEAKLLPGEEAFPEPTTNETYTQEYEYIGVFECSATYLIITGDCLLVADFLINDTLGLPVRPGDNTDDQNAFAFPLDVGWESAVVEMHWDAPLAPMGEKMQLALEPSEAPDEGHAPKYARVTGGSPLAFTVHRDVPHETASASADGETPDMPNPNGGEIVTARAYVLGELHNPGGTSFLGIGAAYGQKFEILVTVFYGEAAPDGFSRLPT